MLCCAVYHADTMVDTYPLPSVADLLMLLPLLCGPSTFERFPLLYLLSFAIKLPEPSTNSSIVVGAACLGLYAEPVDDCSKLLRMEVRACMHVCVWGGGGTSKFNVENVRGSENIL